MGSKTMSNNNYVGEGICGMVMAIATVLQTNEWLQNIQIVICIIAGILGIILTLWKLIKMYQIAKKDGKIDKEEKQDLINQGMELGEQIEDFVNLVSEKTKDKEQK